MLNLLGSGGDGLVAARHLEHYGYNTTIYYPKPGKHPLYPRLLIQLRNLNVPQIDPASFPTALAETDHVVDAIFGFSFSGPLRAPFGDIIQAIIDSKKPVTSVDVPSSWDVEKGPPDEGPGKGFMPMNLVSLTAMKPCARFFVGPGRRHWIGGRFVTREIRERYALYLPPYEGLDQVVEVPVGNAEGEEGGEEEERRRYEEETERRRNNEEKVFWGGVGIDLNKSLGPAEERG